MAKWNFKDILTAFIFNIAVILINQLLVIFVIRNIDVSSVTAMKLYTVLPLISSLVFTYVIKRKGNRVWIAETILASLVLILLMYAWLSPPKPNFITVDSETFGFSILFCMLHCIGLLIGSLFGFFFYQITKKKKTLDKLKKV